jgi:hypothetical protein
MLPPLNGATNDTVTCALPAATLGVGGALGIVLGTTAADAGDGTPVPFAFVAVTVHRYDFAFERLTTTIGEFTPEADPWTPPFDDTHAARKPVIGLPPSNGALNETVTRAFPAADVGCRGASGTRLGTATADGTEGSLSPFPFVAVTVHVYDVPFVRPTTRIGEFAPDADPATPPFDDAHVARKEVIALPPSNGATNDTVSCPLPTPAVGRPGAVGTVLGVTARDAGDGSLAPFAFVAVTVHVYDCPFERPPTEIGELTAEFALGTPPFDEVQAAS